MMAASKPNVAVLVVALLGLVALATLPSVRADGARCTGAGDSLGLLKTWIHHALKPLRLSPFSDCDQNFRALCIPATAQLLENHEGRHKCVYEDIDGHFRVGVGYRLDSERDTRRKELGALLADYQKVLAGETCLNDFQINALLALDAKRVLDQAADEVQALDQFCCDVAAVFGDIVHSAGRKALDGRDFQSFIEKASAKRWEDAAEELKDTSWCDKHRNRCQDNIEIVRKGCGSSSTFSFGRSD